MRIHDLFCPDCGHTFEAFVRSGDSFPNCPQCNSAKAERQPVLRMALGGMRRGRLIDLSSNSCPCGCRGGKHARA